MKDFLKGSLFVLIILPIIEFIVQILQQVTTYVCTRIAAQTYKIQKDNSIDEEPTNTFAIGFHAPEPEEEYYDEEDD